MTPELAAVIASVLVSWTVAWRVGMQLAELLIPALLGIAFAVGTYLGVIGPLGAYGYAGLNLVWAVWVLIPDDDDGEEPVTARFLGTIYRAPAYWLAGALGGFLVVMLGGLALFIVVGIPVGLIDIISNDCDGGFLALGGCEGNGGDKDVETFLDDAGFDVASAIFAGVIAVAAILVAFGLPGYFFREYEEEPPTDRFAKVGWVGFGLWGMAVIGGIGVLMASWIESDQFTGDYSSTRNLDPTPENRIGVPSNAFERDDIRRAEGASQAVRDYCSGAKSEAQYVGCLSHVDESDIP